MLNRTQVDRFGTGWTVEVGMTFINGRIKFAPADASCLCYFDLWADIVPSGLEDGDYTIVAVYAGSQYGQTIEQLSGEAEADAKAILKADEKWLRWAHEEAVERMAAA